MSKKPLEEGGGGGGGGGGGDKQTVLKKLAETELSSLSHLFICHYFSVTMNCEEKLDNALFH